MKAGPAFLVHVKRLHHILGGRSALHLQEEGDVLEVEVASDVKWGAP